MPAGPAPAFPRGLRRRFFLSTGALIAGLMFVVFFLVVSRESRLIRAEVEKRALAVAANLAATSDTALRTYNYVALEQSAEKAAREAGLAYVIFLDKEGRVAAFSGQDDRQGTQLVDPVSRRAQAATAPLVQVTSWDPPGEVHQERVLDVAVPVFFRESTEKWGTVRIGLSLQPLEAELRRTQLALVAVALLALAVGLAGAGALARRVTQPIERLVVGARQLAAGGVGLQLDIRTGDELETLAQAFNHMSAELAAKQAALQRHVDLLTSMKRYQDHILRSMDEGLLTVDLEGNVVTVNRVGAKLLGIDPDAVAGRPLFEAITGAPTSFTKLIRAGLERGEVVTHAEVELESRGNGGSPTSLGVSTAPLLDTDGKQLGLLVLFRDLTELKALEARMRRADKLAALGTMSAGLAHEIRNPLAAIKTFVQLIPRKFDSPAFREKFNVTVPRELDRVNGIIEQLLQLARTPRLCFEPTDVNALLRRILDLHSRQMEEQGVVWEAILADNLPPARADGEYLIRAFGNLVVNAVQAMPSGGRLRVVTARGARPTPGAPERITVRVSDTGVGMDDETVRNLFNPFYTTKAKGTGLGLAITHKIIEEHNGTIVVESAPGAGSTFTVMLPAADPDA